VNGDSVMQSGHRRVWSTDTMSTCIAAISHLLRYGSGKFW